MSSGADDGAGAGRGRSIAWPIFALALGAVVAATAILFFVTFSGPPPMHRPHAIGEVAAALTGKPWRDEPLFGPPPGTAPDAGGRRSPPPFDAHRDHEALRVADTAAPPTAGWRETRDIDTARAIAAAAALPADRVVAFTESGPRPFGRELFGRFTVAARTAAGWRVVRSPEMARFTSWHARTLAAMVVALLVLAVPAWWLSRAITRPLRELAGAAAEARAGATRPDFPRGGASEVRALTRAVAGMHDRLAAHAATRTTLLGAIAHDLGTPLSRLAFWIEHLPEASRDRAAADIEEMRAMIAGTLRFAREEGAALDAARIDLGSLLDSLVDDMQVGGAAVELAPCPRVIVEGDATALRRMFTNLVENALRYGGGAEVACRIEDGQAMVTVADRGPGLGTLAPEQLFEPFVRGDPSRNRSTGGSGLGLSIVRGIAERHGGAARLANRAGGGAVATVTLPLVD